MNFPFGQTVERLRAGMVDDQYSGTQVAADWDNPAVLQLDHAFIAQSSTSRQTSATRTQILEAKSLYCQPDADIQPRDRIRAAGVTYDVDGIPAADVNPFTGWQPVREVPLTRTEG